MELVDSKRPAKATLDSRVVISRPDLKGGFSSKPMSPPGSGPIWRAIKNQDGWVTS